MNNMMLEMVRDAIRKLKTTKHNIKMQKNKISEEDVKDVVMSQFKYIADQMAQGKGERDSYKDKLYLKYIGTFHLKSAKVFEAVKRTLNKIKNESTD